MPRRKITEYKAKTMIAHRLGVAYTGWPITTTSPLPAQVTVINADHAPFVVKVDQGIKGRFKKGLLELDVAAPQLQAAVRRLAKKGYSNFVVEPMVAYDQAAERYLSLDLTREGIMLSYAKEGGINIESNSHKVAQALVRSDSDTFASLARATGLSQATLKAIILTFEQQHLAFLEINPYVVTAQQVYFIDMAVEVDDAGAYFADDWSEDDFVQSAAAQTAEEQAVEVLAAKSPASFKLSVLNPDGAIFLLLSGGGASIAIADEIHAAGAGNLLANYGEYSGNPNAEETYLYTKALIGILLRSKAPSKVLFIGGAVANFTDIATTFTGVMRALEESRDELAAQQVTVFVRRGGPRQEIGLPKMERSLAAMGLLGAVHGPDVTLAAAVHEALEGIR